MAEDAITWHGTKPYQADFSDGARFIAWQYGNTNNSGRSLYQAFNAYWEPLDIVLPPGNWHRLVDTGLPAGQDIVAPTGQNQAGLGQLTQPGQLAPIGQPGQSGQTNQVDQVTTYRIQPRTGIVFESH